MTSNTEWTNYLLHCPIETQEVPGCLYCTVTTRGYAEKIEFTQFGPMPHMLPNPMAFLLKRVKIFGLSGRGWENRADFSLRLGHKILLQRPVWINCLRDSQAVDPPIFIPPLCAFSVVIRNIPEPPATVSRYLANYRRSITVALIGRMIQAVQ